MKSTFIELGRGCYKQIQCECDSEFDKLIIMSMEGFSYMQFTYPIILITNLFTMSPSMELELDMSRNACSNPRLPVLLTDIIDEGRMH